MALCYLNDCPSAIPLLKEAIEDAKAKLQADDFPIGFGDFCWAMPIGNRAI